MASLRLTFPEKDEPTIIALTGARLTIGRLPFNTIQIIDRTVSGFHAELISEHGHYRLHDRGSSNGTFVNGQKVADFHLSEPCTISFGTVEAQFSPEAVPANEEAESFPTRSEINAVRKENVELKATVEALREESTALRQSRPLEGGDAALAVSKEEFDKIVVERESLKEARLRQDEEIDRLKTDLAVLKRDRVNLQLAYDGLQREITDVRAKAGGVQEVEIAPKAAAAVLAAQAPDPGTEVRVDVSEMVTGKTALIPSPIARPAPAAAPAEEKASEAPAAPAAPPAPAAPAVPTAPPAAPSYPRPPASAPRPPSAPSTPMKPFAPLPKAAPLAATVIAKPVGAPMPAAPAAVKPAEPATPPSSSDKPSAPKAPVGLGTGIRPMGKPPGPLPATPIPNADSENSEDDDSLATTVRIVPPTRPTMKLPAEPIKRMPPKPIVPAAPVVGPKGTQKLS